MAVDLSNSYTTEAFKLTETVKIPKNWTGDRDIKTRTQLLEARKKEFIPDISFDLDGDGVVGPQDYYVSKNFCKENNNKLTAQEKTQALEALKTGYIDNMLWGLDGSGATKPYRVIQMRGKIVLNEDFIKVNETHPKNQSPPPKIACKTQLNESRKEKDKETGKEFEIRRGYQFRYNLPLNEIISTDSFSNDPKYKTIQDRKDFERGLARTGMGLLNEIEAPKVGFSYTADPKNRTRSHMRGRRKEEMVDVLNKTANYGHIGESERMRIREERNALISYRDELPKQKILERKIMDTHQLGEKFSKTTVGVHGCELPRYAENSREYWKMDEKSQSCENSFLQTSKSFKAAQEHERFENDAFKQHYHVNKHIKDIPLEPNKIVHSTSISNNPNARNSRWTTYNDNFYDRRASPVAETSFITDKKHAQKARTTISKFRGTHTSITNRMGQRGSQSPIRQTLRSAGFL